MIPLTTLIFLIEHNKFLFPIYSWNEYQLFLCIQIKNTVQIVECIIVLLIVNSMATLRQLPGKNVNKLTNTNQTFVSSSVSWIFICYLFYSLILRLCEICSPVNLKKFNHLSGTILRIIFQRKENDFGECKPFHWRRTEWFIMNTLNHTVRYQRL